jgi:O-methyltransferase
MALPRQLTRARDRLRRSRDPERWSPTMSDYAGGALARIGFEVRRVPKAGKLAATHPDLEPEFGDAFALAEPFTMTSVERMYALWQAVGHIHRAGVPGDVVECGVWRGGSSLLAADTLARLGDESRTIWLYDTFEGMSEPTDRDVSFDGDRIVDRWSVLREDRDDPVLCYADLPDVKATMARSGYPADRIRYVQGKVEDTIPADCPESIALLRLDTDWYESTRHELEHLYPRLAPGGVLILDDYGDWKGARDATDEYFAQHPDPPLLQRIDQTGRIAVKLVSSPTT